ncbi:MAG: type II secretion system protein N, partial [Candidatus Omnitrophota bacterium]
SMPIDNHPIRSRSFNRFSFRTVNTILVLLVAILAVYLLAQFLSWPRRISLPTDSGATTSDADFRVAQMPAAKPYDYYAKQFAAKDIFGAASGGDSSVTLPVGQSAAQIAKDLKLVGVVMDAQPQAAIENKAENKTYFLEVGDMINGMKIDSISENRVILNYSGQRIELSL